VPFEDVAVVLAIAVKKEDKSAGLFNQTLLKF
jgi:hypothetical protein